jgi:hypothetical protein
MILDLDSPLREGYFTDGVYEHGGLCEKFTPRKMARKERPRENAARLLNP